MRRQKAWSLVALLFAACAIPDVEVIPTPGSDAGTSSEDTGGTADQGGSSNGSGKAGSKNETGNAGADSSNAAGDATGPGGSPGTEGGTTSVAGKATGGSGGSRPSGGSPGTGGTGGSGTGGGGSGGSSGTGGTGTGTAVGKFCSDITYNGAAISLRLEVGSGANKITFVTSSETCTPVVNTACTSIPLGSAVVVTLIDPSTTPPTTLYANTANIKAGQAWVFFASFNGTAPTLDGDPTYTPAECKADDFAAIVSGA